MNFIFISPQFPSNHWNFCAQLKNNGVNVLGIGDASYDSLKYQLKSVLTEYYKVENLEDYNQVMKAVAYFTFKYGKIDWLESNNEYWIEQDAKLRTDFHITTGFNLDEVQKAKYKSIMKELYQQFQIPTIPYVIVDHPEKCRAFAEKTGYPIVVKPDRGMKLGEVQLLNNETDLEEFLNSSRNGTWIMEPYINGTVWSYDAIVNSNETPVFESGSVTSISALDVVNQQEDVYFYVLKKIPEDLKEIGRHCIKAFDVKRRFIHFEFFRLNRDQEGVGKKGDLIALESNMCPKGGYMFDMLNYANSTDVYRIWASMVAFDDYKETNHYDQFFCCFIIRRDDKNYIHSHNEVLSKYRANITLSNKISEDNITGVNGQIYLAKFAEETAMKQFVQFALSRLNNCC